ncbi:unnamed protein product [Arctia plantaginis]|uniref:Major facilitator superfamily (MFS) profile domain-containing protein n=1 Tax=Arctia plantaginis TaxID=874455 RepID=A0A8S1BCF9_ARCPL|nr:unnamed protein product [Arctia plantaginis]
MDKKSNESGCDLEFETVLYREVGQFGKFQLITIALASFSSLICGFMATDYIFTIGRLPYRCVIPECDYPEPEFLPQWIANAVPSTASGLDSCNRYVNVTDESTLTPGTDEICPAILFNRNKTISCDSYVHERTNTAVYDFNLECQEWLRALPGTLNSAGGMVALILAGFVSDRLGRKISIVFFSLNVALVGVIRAFSVNLAMYAALQFLQTAIGGGAFSAVYILASEIVGPEFRVKTSATISSTFAMGQVILGVIAFLIPAWRTLTLVLYVPVFLAVSYYWIGNESFRWLLSKNKQKEGRASLEYAARLNGKRISDESMNFLLTAIPRQMEAQKHLNEHSVLYRVIKSPVLLRRCCTTPFLWMTTTFIYYGLSINSVGLSGWSSMLGRIGSIIAPLTPALMVYWSGIPSIMFAVTAIISGFLVLTQPETMGLKVPDTIEDAEYLGK